MRLQPCPRSSAWHAVASDELWLRHGPDPVVLELGGSGGRPRTSARIELGPDAVQGLVPAGVWQRTLPSVGEALVGCVVSPGFDFADFVLAD